MNKELFEVIGVEDEEIRLWTEEAEAEEYQQQLEELGFYVQDPNYIRYTMW